MVGVQHATELTPPRCVDSSGQICPSPLERWCPTHPSTTRVWCTASSPPPACLSRSSTPCRMAPHTAAPVGRCFSTTRQRQRRALSTTTQRQPRGGERPEEGQGRWGDLHVHGVGRRREDEYLDGDDNQEDEPTHKGADAGHQNDDSSSCTTSHCGGYRFGSLHGRAECYYLDVRCLMYWMFVKLCIYELDV
ncbi:uncharacterized protein LOC119303789 isoform X2 [Triticum dicoccoides]|uniref:uncharacterized protein LOC119303789 isoform X2 n=1 Tax=Triticum dicoccoides TaxID=85692 RepID=UPI00188F76C9|nr:uncharacterized protein LOC119303789 isoform X2 [Triticum dicoccoides]